MPLARFTGGRQTDIILCVSNLSNSQMCYCEQTLMKRGREMSTHLYLSAADIYIVHSLAAVIAPLLFLVYYISYLMAETKSCKSIEPISLPWWMNFMYPRWLDKLTVQGIAKAFIRALGMAIISMIGLGIIFLIFVGKDWVR